MFDNASAELLWFLVGLVLLLSELALPGFVIVFFGVGAWVTAVLVGFGLLPGFNAQLLVFLITSILALALFRNKGRKYFEGRVSRIWNPAASMEDLHGERAIVTSSINPNADGGKVEFHGTLWNADADMPIEKGQVVEIVEQKNLRLKVKLLA
jgi:membrane protein implicated in regulation of membrane protease activity